MNSYIQDEQFQGINVKEAGTKADYENCVFTNCNFSGANLSGWSFMECEFEDCDFSSAKITGTGFKEVSFRNCKLMGLAFESCSDFLLSFEFRDCILNFSSFFRLKAPDTRFSNCRLQEVDFSEADLSGASFTGCDLAGAIFINTRLKQTDFRNALNYSINPQVNTIEKAKFSLPEVVGLLDVFKISIE